MNNCKLKKKSRWGTTLLCVAPRFLFIVILLLHHELTFPFSQDVSTDTTFTMLDEIEITQSGKAAIRPKSSGNLSLDSETVLKLTRNFGEPDMVTLIKGLTGVSTSGDYGSGISIDGTSPSQTIYQIDGATVIFPYRFGGIFSTFNTPHFSAMDFTRAALPASSDTRLGSRLNFSPSYSADKSISGILNIGLLSSSVTIKAAPSKKIFATASARLSYINHLYGKYLKQQSYTLLYNFHDINLSIGYLASKKDSIFLNGFLSTDKINYDDVNYQTTTGMKWENKLVALKWGHDGRLPLSLSAHYTRFDSYLDFAIPQIGIQGPSMIEIADLNIEFNTSLSKKSAIVYGLQTEYGHSRPQYPILELPINNHYGGQTPSVNNADNLPDLPCQRFMFARGFTSFRLNASDHLILETGLSIGDYISDKNHLVLDPRITLEWKNRTGAYTFHAGGYSQYLHHLGFSDLGLASNFWITADEKVPIQHAWTFNLNWQKTLGFLGTTIDAGCYCSLVGNQTEFRGELLETIDSEYDPFTHIIVSNGINMGVHVNLRRDFGKITGSIGYSYGYGHRHAKNDGNAKWRALTDPGNTLLASVGWHIDSHWELNANFKYSSGRVYTPVKALYMIAGNIAIQYGQQNGGRLPNYQRLDLGASYKWISGKRQKLRHILNASLINAYGHDNVEMQYFIFNSKSGDYTLKRLNSLYRFLPSLSYTIIY